MCNELDEGSLSHLDILALADIAFGDQCNACADRAGAAAANHAEGAKTRCQLQRRICCT
jgi:hypothetical protein